MSSPVGAFNSSISTFNYILPYEDQPSPIVRSKIYQVSYPKFYIMFHDELAICRYKIKDGKFKNKFRILSLDNLEIVHRGMRDTALFELPKISSTSLLSYNCLESSSSSSSSQPEDSTEGEVPINSKEAAVRVSYEESDLELYGRIFIYRRKIVDGKREGNNDKLLRADTGEVFYKGKTVDGIPDGAGKMTFSNGDWRQGDFVKGVFKKGIAKVTFYLQGDRSTLDRIYIGAYSNEAPNGIGSMMFSKKSYYQGEFLNGNLHGNGTFVYDDGSVYKGEFENGHPEGFGQFKFSSGALYKGMVAGGVMHGTGKISFKNGGSYNGDFVYGQMYGYGALFYADKSSYSGEFVQNKREGKGVYTSGEGVIYKGNFQQNKLHGIVTATLPSGEKYRQVWADGVLKSMKKSKCVD